MNPKWWKTLGLGGQVDGKPEVNSLGNQLLGQAYPKIFKARYQHVTDRPDLTGLGLDLSQESMNESPYLLIASFWTP